MIQSESPPHTHSHQPSTLSRTLMIPWKNRNQTLHASQIPLPTGRAPHHRYWEGSHWCQTRSAVSSLPCACDAPESEFRTTGRIWRRERKHICDTQLQRRGVGGGLRKAQHVVSHIKLCVRGEKIFFFFYFIPNIKELWHCCIWSG